MVFRAVACVVFFGIGLAIAEVALRLLPLRQTTAPAPEIEAFGWESATGPDLRDRTVADDPESFRILVVGDSFTWGGGVYSEDAYPDRLQVRIDRAGLGDGRPIEVINWSRPGWNTVQELYWLRELRPALGADLLILGVCLNDPEPTDRIQRLRARTAILRRTPTGPIAEHLYAWSRLYALAFDRLENRRQRRAFVDHYRSLYQPSPDWRAFFDALKGFRHFARRHGAPLLLVVFPIFDSQLDEYRYAEHHATLREVAERLGLPVLDLLPAYRGVDARRLAVEPFTDAHPSEIAHRIAADRILEHLIEKRLLPLADPAAE